MDSRALKAKLTYAGLSQRDVAAALNISVQTVNSRINGKSEFEAGEIAKLCELARIDTPEEKVAIFLT